MILHGDEMKNGLFLLVTSASLSLSGCATITRGSEDVLVVETEPSGASVSTTNGFSCKSTPCSLKMPRRSDLVVTIKKPKCKTAQVQVTHKTADAGAAGVAGNVLVGGIIGLAVDAGTGASQDLTPNPVKVTLECRK
jgi:outer membrane lipoprotein SlyB